jgi:hypothetical protein
VRFGEWGQAPYQGRHNRSLRLEHPYGTASLFLWRWGSARPITNDKAIYRKLEFRRAPRAGRSTSNRRRRTMLELIVTSRSMFRPDDRHDRSRSRAMTFDNVGDPFSSGRSRPFGGMWK